MADLSILNIGGSDYNVKDAISRTNSVNAQNLAAYREDTNTASQAYSVIGTPINWKGTLYYTKTAVAAGATWVEGVNLTAANNLGRLVTNIKTYVNNDGELVFRDLTGADTVLPFNAGTQFLENVTFSGGSGSGNYYDTLVYDSGQTGYSHAGIVSVSGIMYKKSNNARVDALCCYASVDPNTGIVTITGGTYSGTAYAFHKSYLPNPWSIVLGK